jgi:hypothetical protein
VRYVDRLWRKSIEICVFLNQARANGNGVQKIWGFVWSFSLFLPTIRIGPSRVLFPHPAYKSFLQHAYINHYSLQPWQWRQHILLKVWYPSIRPRVSSVRGPQSECKHKNNAVVLQCCISPCILLYTQEKSNQQIHFIWGIFTIYFLLIA